MPSPGVSKAQSAVVNDSPVGCQSRRPGAPQSTRWPSDSEVGCGMREIRLDIVNVSGLPKFLNFLGLILVPHPALLPAFHISHQNRFRSADFGDSFSPGEAKGAPAPVQPHNKPKGTQSRPFFYIIPGFCASSAPAYGCCGPAPACGCAKIWGYTPAAHHLPKIPGTAPGS